MEQGKPGTKRQLHSKAGGETASLTAQPDLFIDALALSAAQLRTPFHKYIETDVVLEPTANRHSWRGCHWINSPTFPLITPPPKIEQKIRSACVLFLMFACQREMLFKSDTVFVFFFESQNMIS